MVEVLIAGAGPAGAVTALVLARAGLRVLLLDRATFPRDKLCGDTVNPGALALLDRLGIREAAERDALPLDGMIVTGATGVRIEGRYGRGLHACSIVRRGLDHRLLEHAAAAGAQIELGARVVEPLVDADGDTTVVRGVKVEARGETLRIPAALTVAADGRHSTLAFALGLARHPLRPRRWAVGGYFENVAGLGSFGEMHIRHAHYMGVAPVPGDLTNACLVTVAQPELRDPGALLLTRLLADPQLKDRFAGARLVAPAVSMGPLAVDVRGAGLPGLLLAGDAAGFIDPMTGDGLRFAIEGGQLAAESAIAALAQPGVPAHLRLAQARRVRFRRKCQLNRALRAIVGSPRAIDAAAGIATLAPAVLKRLVGLAGDVPLARALQPAIPPSAHVAAP